jgi:hypothetical protein
MPGEDCNFYSPPPPTPDPGPEPDDCLILQKCDPFTPIPSDLPSEPDVAWGEEAFQWARQSLLWLQSQGYSVEQAIAFILSEELGSLIKNNTIYKLALEAMTRKYNQYCSGGAGTAMCIRAFWAYWQPMINLFNSPSLQKNIRGLFVSEQRTDFMNAAIRVLNNPNLGGQDGHLPSGWATINSEDNPETFAKVIALTVGTQSDQVYYKSRNGIYFFIILSPDQQSFVCGGKCDEAD